MNILETAFSSQFWSPQPWQIAGFVAVLGITLGFALLGGWIGGRDRMAEADLVVGWGVGGLAFVVLGTFPAVPFTAIAALLGVASLGGGALLWRRDRALLPPGTFKVAVLMVPLLALVVGMVASQWDEFTTWLPNARYIIEHDSFPRQGLPVSTSVLAAYPYGTGIVIYLASQITNGFVENGTTLFNLILLLVTALMAGRLLSKDALDLRTRPVTWLSAALGLLVVTGLNPSFVQRLTLTAYADTSTAVALAFFVILGWIAIERLRDGNVASARVLALQAGLVAATLINIKQVNIILFALAVAGFCLVVLRDRAVSVRVFAPLLVRMSLPVVVIYVIWRMYISINISGAEPSIRPMSDWNTHLIPVILNSMGSVILNSMGSVIPKIIGYFLLMLVISVFGVVGLVRMKTPGHRLALVVGIMFAGYNIFLFLTYIVVFGDYEGSRAASYWRYNTHLGVIGILSACFFAGQAWHRRRAQRGKVKWLRFNPAWALVPLLLVFPLIFAKKIRFDIHPVKMYTRTIGADMAPLLPPESYLAVFYPYGHGFYGNLLKYQINRPGVTFQNLTAFTGHAAIKKLIDESAYTHIWVFLADEISDSLLGQTLDRGASHLLVRTPDGWDVVKS